jgi:protein phosphatase methylesterase 1
LHGAGLSGSSFAPAALLSKTIPVQLVSFDFRGHGQCAESDLDNDLSSNSLISDGLKVLSFITSKKPDESIVLVGHSMGGAIATKLAVEYQNKGGVIAGLIVVDIVEEQAISAIPNMQAIINQKPKSFENVEKAIEWAFLSKTVRKLYSARISIPVQLKTVSGALVWRTDLKKTLPFWEDWFRGMNNAFLSFQGPKELILAENDLTDHQMMIAYIQHKYKRSIFYNVGHMVQEDDPERFVKEISTFLSAFKIQ